MKLIDAPQNLYGWEVRDGYRWTGPARRAAASSYCVQDMGRQALLEAGWLAAGLPWDSRMGLLVEGGGREGGRVGGPAYRGVCALALVTDAQASLEVGQRRGARDWCDGA